MLTSDKGPSEYDRIKQLVDGPYLEMFARHTRSGWDGWGNQTTLFSEGLVETRRLPSDLRRYPLQEEEQ